MPREERSPSRLADDLIGLLLYLVTGNTGHSRLPIFFRQDRK